MLSCKCMSVSLLSLLGSVKCLHCLYIRVCPCTAVMFLVAAQAQHGWRSVEIIHFPLCRGVPLCGVFFLGGYLTASVKEQKVDIHVIKILLTESDWEFPGVKVRNCHCRGTLVQEMWINPVTSQESIKWADWSVTDLQHLISAVAGSWQLVLAVRGCGWKQSCVSATFVSFRAGHQAQCTYRGTKTTARVAESC